MEDLNPITWNEARQAFNEAAAQWNSGSRNSIRLANVQNTPQGNQIYSKEFPPWDDALAYALCEELETRDGRQYLRPTDLFIKFNSRRKWSKYGGLNGPPPYSVRYVALHELGHWLDLYDIKDSSYYDSVMWHQYKNDHQLFLDQTDKDTIWRIYSDPRWNQLDMGVFYLNGGYQTIWGKVWRPGWYHHSSTGPYNPSDMTVGQSRTFYVDTSGIRGAEDFSYPAHTIDITMRLIWRETALSFKTGDFFVETPYVTTDTWWFSENPYFGEDTAWLCANFNANQFSSSTHAGAELWVELEANQPDTYVPVIVRVTSADYHANPWVVRAENTFRFDIN